MSRRMMRRKETGRTIGVCEPLEVRRLLAAFLKLDGGQVPTPEPLVNVSADATNHQSEMMIAVNPTNPLNVIGFSHRIRPNPNPIELDIYRTADGGTTWTTILIDNTDDGLGTTGNRFDPALAFDGNGVLYLAYGYRGTTPDRLVAATSTDGGANFGNFRVIDSQNGFTPTGGNALPGVDRWGIATGRVAGTNNQCAVIAYTQNGQEGGNTDQRIAVLGTNNAGNTWTAPLVINDASNSGTDTGNLGACPAIGFDGNLHVSWWDGGTSIFMDTDRDGLFANNFNFGQEQAVRTNQGLVTIGPPGPPAQPQRGIRMNPFMVAHPRITGELYLTFQERFGTTGNDTDIFFGRSTNFGATWTFSGVETATSTDFHPVIAVDEQSNAIGVAYYTTDGDQNTGNDDVRMRIALTRDFGASWGKANAAAQQSNEAGGYGGDYLEYTGLAMRDGTAHVLWASRYPGPGGVVGTDLDALWVRASFDSTANNNRIDVVGTPTNANNTYVIRRSPANNQYLEIFTDGVRDYTGLIASIDGIDIAPNGGNDTFRFENLPPIPIVIGGTVFNDGFNIDHATGASSITINGFAGDDTFTLGQDVNSFLTITTPITIFGHDGSDTLNFGNGNAGAVGANVTFHAGGGGFLDTVDVNDGGMTALVEYDVTPTALIRHGFAPPVTLTHSGLDDIEIFAGSGGDEFIVRNGVSTITRCFGNGGNDNFTFGDGLLTPGAGHVFNGGQGNDTLTFDDRNQSGARLWDVFNDRVIYGGIFNFLTAGFEGVRVLAGNGGDTISLSGQTFTQEIIIDAGGGNDAINTQGSVNPSLTIRGGAGNFDNLNLDDRTFPSAGQTATSVHTDRINRFYPTAVMLMNYDGLEGVAYRLPPSQNEVQVFGVSSNIPGSNSFQIIGNAQRDLVIVYPTPATPNINGPLYITGAGGADEVALVDDGGAPGTYTLSNPVGGGAAFIFGSFVSAAGNVGVQNDVEALNIYGGGGNDNFVVEQFQSGSAVALYGRGGDDTCTIGNGNMQANLTSAAAFTFDGGAGTDRFTIANGLTNLAWNYSPGDTSVNASIIGVYSWTSNTKDIESQYIFAGSSNDSFLIGSVPAGLYTECNGGAGYDAIGMGFGFANVDLASIRGPVRFNAGAGGGRANIDDSADTTGDVVHLTATTLGAYASDTLFGPGGSFTFSDLANQGTSDGLVLQLGSGADTVYAQPLAGSRATIDANAPGAAPGDTLNLALAGVQGANVTHGASGSVTSSNRQTLSWTGMEQSTQPIDNVAPALVAADMNINGIPGPGDGGTRRQSLDVRFSENVAGLLGPSWLQLTNLTTNQAVPTSNIAVEYESATNTARFTFPEYPLGILPDGNYGGKILAGLPDFFGNGLPADANFNFFFLQGDANHDRRVNLSDFNLLAANFGQSGRTFGQADFNYDGTVDLADFNILAARFGTVLQEPGARGGAGGGEIVWTPFRTVRAGDVVKSRHSQRLVTMLNDVLS